VDEVTEDIVREKLSTARQKFAMALLDIAASGKNIDLKNRLQYILDFLLQAKNLPAAKIEEAAIAALAIIATPEPAAKILQFEDRPGAYHPDTSDLDRTNPPQGSAA
jgi:hypothetical protein